MSVETRTVDDVDHVLDGTLDDSSVDADVAYDYDVPDVERRIIHPKVGPDESNMEN